AGCVQSMRHRRHGRQLPIAEVSREDQRRFSGQAQLGEQLMRTRPDFDPAFFRKSRVVLPDMIEMGKLGAQTPVKMVSISSGDFSGKAAVRLARPIRCSRVKGPIRRVTRPRKLAVLTGSK